MPSVLSIVGVKSVIFIVKVFVYTYEIITWPIYSLFRRSIQYMPSASECSSEDIKYDPEKRRTLAMPTRHGDPSAPWRAVEAMDELLSTPAAGCDTAVNLWLRSYNLYGQRESFGTREVLKSEFETGQGGRQFVKLTLGKYHWETMKEAELRVSMMAAGLDSLLKSDASGRVAIFSETRAEWLYAAQAILRLGRTIVTLYATLGEEALVHGLNETNARVLFVGEELVAKVPAVLKKCPSVQLVVYFTNGIFHYRPALRVPQRVEASVQAQIEKAKASLEVKLMDVVELEKLGLASFSEEQRRKGSWMPPDQSTWPKADDLAVIMYTSGSTGVPKGVELTHLCLTSAIAGFVRRLPPIRETDTYIAYLPLAHVFEMACELTCLFQGARLGYGNPQTLTNNSTRIKVGACKGDAAILRPTIMAAVPTVLQRVEKAVWEKLTEDGLMAKRLFKFAFDYKLRRLRAGYPSFLVDRLVFRKVRRILGGKLRYLMSGGAPLSESSQMFAYVCFGPVIQGYGLTETFCSGCIMETGDMRTKHVGAPVSTVEILLRPWDEGGYSPFDKPHPRGEVLIGGASISRGYFMQPKLTASDFFVDPASGRRFFCTGDIGQFNPDGTLSIIDRKKDLVKLQAGEYVSLAKVELALGQSVYVETVCVYARPDQCFTVCFVSPKKKQLRDLALRLGAMPSKEQIQQLCQQEQLTEENALHQLLCETAKVKEGVLQDLKVQSREAKLQTFEIPQRIHLDPSMWTPESGLVTDALKLKRFNLQAKFQAAIDQMYGLKKST